MIIFLVVLQNCKHVLLQQLPSFHCFSLASFLHLEVNVLVLVYQHLCYL